MNTFIKIILGGLMLLMLKDANSQSPGKEQLLEVTYNKTVSICFPAVIKSVDRGSRDLMAQKAKGVENILQLKAARENFPETNLTVITADGLIHEFTVTYASEPDKLVVNPNGTATEPKSTALIFETSMTEDEFDHCAKKLIQSKRSIRFHSEKKYKVGLTLIGIYINGSTIFYHLRISNSSNIKYDVDFLKLYIKDKEKVKRTASQEVSIETIYSFGNAASIEGKSSQDVVYALEKFTIPDAKRLVIEMYEKNGGRNLNLSIKNKTIVNALLVD